MSDTCRMLGCENEPGSADTDTTYRSRRFCSPACDVTYEKRRADARDAERSDRR